jgi:hypothetical protein
MDDDQQPVTRLGPDSGGRAPNEQTVRVYTWEWGPEEGRRPGLPWIGIFLLVFGALLLIQQLFPEAKALGSLVFIAIGVAFLIKWAIDRGTGSLYAGAIITALAVPSALTNAGLGREGVGTLALGVAFLFIALIRAMSGGGIGWQAWIGGLLAVIGGVSVVQPQVGGLLVPVALVVLGVLLLGGGLRFDSRRFR